MDKKKKKRLDVLRKKIHQLEQKLTGAKQQPDDPDEPARIQAEMDALKAEASSLKAE